MSRERMFGASSFMSRRKKYRRNGGAGCAENSINSGVGAMLPLPMRPSTWLRGRGRDRVALPRQRDLEGIRNRGSVPKRGLTQSQYANGLTHRAALHSGCHTPKPRARAQRESRSKPYVRIPRESVPLSVIHAFFYKYIVLSD